MECLSYVDLSHDYSKSIIFNNMSPHYRHMYLYPPPFKLCHLCQMYMKPQVRPAGPSSWSPLLPLLWEFNNSRVIIPRSLLSPHPPICWWCWAWSPTPPPRPCSATPPPSSQSPFLPAIPIWNKEFKSPNNLKLDQVMFIHQWSAMRNSVVWLERGPPPPRPTL